MTVLNKHHGNIPADAVYIGRGSKWGNPFVIGRDGDRNEVCNAYDRYAPTHFTKKELASLHGKDLVCFCAPARCHGHTLEMLAKLAHHELQGE